MWARLETPHRTPDRASGTSLGGRQRASTQLPLTAGLLLTTALLNLYLHTGMPSSTSVVLMGAVFSYVYFLIVLVAALLSTGAHPWAIWAATSISTAVHAAAHPADLGLALVAVLYCGGSGLTVEAIRRLRVARSQYEQDLAALDDANADVRKRLAEQSALFEVSHNLSITFDIERLFYDAMECIARRLNMYRGTLCLFDAETQELRVKHAYGLTPDEIRTGRYRLGEGIYGTVMETGEPMAIPNLGEEPIFLRTPERDSGALERDTRSIAFICMPIKMEGRTVGVLTVDRAPVDQRTLGDDLSFLAILASTFAQALKIQEMIEALVSQERWAVLGTMARSVAHEVRNPLGGIRGAAQLLAMDVTAGASDDGATQEAQKYADVIVREVDRLNRVVEQLLHFGSPQTHNRESLYIEKIVDRVVFLVASNAESTGVKMGRSSEEALPPVHVDEDQMTQVLLNLVRNAVEAMPDGGDLTIVTRNASLAASSAEEEELPAIEVQVCDTGTGVPREVRDKVFGPLYTTKQKGTGIGLALTKRLVEEHGGRVSIHDNAPHGTRVSVLLPVALSTRDGSNQVGEVG